MVGTSGLAVAAIVGVAANLAWLQRLSPASAALNSGFRDRMWWLINAAAAST